MKMSCTRGKKKKSRSMGLHRYMLTMQESTEEKTNEKQRENEKQERIARKSSVNAR